MVYRVCDAFSFILLASAKVEGILVFSMVKAEHQIHLYQYFDSRRGMLIDIEVPTVEGKLKQVILINFIEEEFQLS